MPDLQNILIIALAVVSGGGAVTLAVLAIVSADRDRFARRVDDLAARGGEGGH